MSALSQVHKHSWLAYRFTYGDPASPTYSRYTDYPSSIIGPDGGLYSSRPAIGIKPVNYAGTFGEAPVKIKMDLGATDSFTDRISSGEPHSPVSVDIWEIVDPAPGSLPKQELLLFSGDMQTVSRNADGHSGIIEIEVANLKNQLDVPLGIPLLPHCVWTFTKRGCFKSSVGLAETGTLTSLLSTDKQIATITGLSAHTGKYWHRGYVEVDGLRIRIRDWNSTAATTFMLGLEPPARWVGGSVTVFPGCDKQLVTCRTRWNNEEHFGGAGFAVPAYHPVVEDGAV